MGGVNSVTETLKHRMDHLVFVMQKPVPLLPKESVLWNSHIGGHFDKTSISLRMVISYGLAILHPGNYSVQFC